MRSQEAKEAKETSRVLEHKARARFLHPSPTCGFVMLCQGQDGKLEK